jgi:hypothetical protein
MKIWLIEDDPTQAEDIAAGLRKYLGQSDLPEIKRVATESEFRRRFDEIAASEPAAVVLDLLLRWTDAGPDMEPLPPEIDPVTGYLTAGLRCQQRLAADARTEVVPVVIYTIVNGGSVGIEPGTLTGNVRLVRKETSYANLIEAVKNLTTR